MFVIDDIIAELVSQGVVQVQERINRSEKAVQILRKFNLKSSEPPDDFEEMYVYTLIEYGVGKPQEIFELFREAKIQEIFQEAFIHNNLSLLLEKTANYLTDHQIEFHNIDYQRELAEFSAIFIKILESTHTPKEIREQHQLQNLQNSIDELHQQFNYLNLGELKALIGNAQSLLPPSQPQDSKLAEQMRGWFEALKYHFEDYQISAENYFEWIINIPARRGYDRILVRGIEGEAGLDDLQALRQSVNQQNTDEGWLVSFRRVSKVARNAVEKPENRDLFCYTFDELLDDVANFDRYFEWLEEQVKSRKIDQYYVPLACRKEEIDPSTQQPIGISRYGEQDGWIEGYIDIWLDDPAKEHLSVLGEFGTGKTWFAFHYAWVALQAYLTAKKRGVERPRLPLVIPLRDYATAVTVESLFSEFFFRKHEIKLPGYSAFEQLNRMGKLLLIFDGFDEMAARVDRQAMINNFWELAKVVIPGSKAILTCRTEHFPEAKEGRSLLNAELQASTANLTAESPQSEGDYMPAHRSLLEFFVAYKLVAELGILADDFTEVAQHRNCIDSQLPSQNYTWQTYFQRQSDTYLAPLNRFHPEPLDLLFTHLGDTPLSKAVLDLAIPMLNSDGVLDHLLKLIQATRNKPESDVGYLPGNLLKLLIGYHPRSLENSYLSNIVIKDVNFSNISLRGTNFSEATIIDCVFNRVLSAVFSVAFSPDGKILAVGDDRGIIQFWDSITGQILRVLSGHLSGINSVAFSPDGQIFATGSDDNTIKLWSLGNNQCLAILEGHSDRVRSVAFSPDGQILASSSSDNTIKLWSISSKDCFTTFDHGECFAILKGHSDRVYSIAFSPNGQILASGSSDHTVKLWSINDGNCLATLEGHSDWVFSVVFSPDGKILASGSDDNAIKIWRVNDGKCIATFVGHSHWVRSVAFSPNGTILASGSWDETIRIWDVQTGECLRVITDKIYAGLNLTGVKGLTAVEIATLKALGAVEISPQILAPKSPILGTLRSGKL